MRICFFVLVTLLAVKCSYGQEIDPVREQQLEDLAEKQDAESKDDYAMQQYEHYHIHPVNLNAVDAAGLAEFDLLNSLQIAEFISYRSLLGKLISIYELQAIPGWDLQTIRTLLPFVRVAENDGIAATLRQRLHGGTDRILMRTSMQLEKSRGYDRPVDSGASYYAGSRQKLMMRFGYNYKNILQYGLLGDKDAGEQFFRGYQKQGFDFYSFHFFIRNLGLIKAFALGDFTANFGQGLIQWQSLAFGKGAQVLSMKREASVIRPYNSAGEFNFHRGIAATVKLGLIECTGFFSLRHVSANLVTDTLGRQDEFSSFETSGYHRTPSENEDRNSLRQIAVGGNIQVSGNQYHAGLSMMQYYFSHNLEKQDVPYNAFAIRGRVWNDVSGDYSCTYHNMHLFGEVAMDKRGQLAVVDGILTSLGADADAGIIYRSISKGFQSLYSNAFTESSTVNNEQGLYASLSVRPARFLKIDFYFDVFSFPWLKYLVDAPGAGRSYFTQLLYQPNKNSSWYSRFKTDQRQSNLSTSSGAVPQLRTATVNDLRTEWKHSFRKNITVRTRLEYLWYDPGSADHEKGKMALFDVIYHPRLRPYSGNMRVQYVNTDSYNSRIYAYESDVLYENSTPAVYGHTLRYYINLGISVRRVFHLEKHFGSGLTIWLRWAQSLYPAHTVIATGLDQYTGSHKSEIKLQLACNW